MTINTFIESIFSQRVPLLCVGGLDFAFRFAVSICICKITIISVIFGKCKKLLTRLDNSVKIPFAAYWGRAVCTENKCACAHGSESIFKVG